MDKLIRVGYRGRRHYRDPDDPGWGIWKFIESCDEALWIHCSKYYPDEYELQEVFIKEE